MTDNRTHLDFPVVGVNEPLVNDPFYAWLTANVTRLEPGRFLDHLITYLEGYGYDKDLHIIGEEAYKTLEYVYQVWVDTTPFFPPHSMNELFSDSVGPKYFIQGVKERNDPHTGATPKLLEMVQESGWVYNVGPDNCYFELIGDRLLAKYHQIIGSRFICRVKGVAE